MKPRLAPLALAFALAALLSIPVGASAVHWPNFGGDAGRSGDQPVEPPQLPIKSSYRKTEAGRIQTSVITSAGGPATTQRMVYGTINKPSTSSNNRTCNVHLQILATGAPVGPEGGVDVCTDNDDATEDDAFGTRAIHGSVTPVETSSGSSLGQVYVIHNDDDATPIAEGAAGQCDFSDNDIAIAQIDETDGTLVKDVAFGGASAVPSPPLPATCGSDATTEGGKQHAADFTAESSPVITPVLNPPGDTRALFFLAERSTDGMVRLFKATIANSSSKSATFSFSSRDVPGANHLASPSIAYFQDPERPGTIAPYVVVPTQNGAVSGLATYRVSDLAPGPFVPENTADTAGTPWTPSSPVTSTGAVPGSTGSGASQTKFVYVAYENGDTTVVRKFQQKGDSNELEPVGAPSMALAGKPSRALALRQEVVDGTPQAGGEVVVTTHQNLFVLNADSLAVEAAMQDNGETPLSGDAGFSRTVPAVSGEHAFVARDNGNQLVVRLSDAERVCSAGDVRAECATRGDEFTEHSGNSGGGAEAPSSFSIGQPSISRGFIQYTSDKGAFVYRGTDPDEKPPVVDVTQPADGSKVSGSSVKVAAKATDPDNLGIVKVEFFLDPATNPPCNPEYPGGKIGEDTTAEGDNEYAIAWDSTKCADRTYTLTAKATDASGASSSDSISVEVDNVTDPTASFTTSPASPQPTGTEITFDASGSAPAGTPSGQAIVKYEWDFDGDGTYEVTGDPETAQVVKHTYSTAATYNPTLRVTQTNGEDDTETQSYTVTNRPPVASFSAEPNPAQAGQDITFDASASQDPDGQITKYEWDFDGDGAFDRTTADPKTTHSYGSAGKRTVTLTVTDGSGATSQSAREVQVTGPNVPPTASFSANPNPAPVDRNVVFDATASRDSDGSIVKYEWDLDGNGTFETDSGSNPRTQRSYSTVNVYNVKLRVTDNTGARAETVRQLTVTRVERARLALRGLTVKVRPKRDRTLPYVFRTTGRLRLPSGVQRTDGCVGRVTIVFKAGKKTISRRTTAVRSNCTYRTRVKFRDRKRIGRKRKALRIIARFQGNNALLPKKAKTRKVRVG